MYYYRAWAEIDLDALTRNFERIVSRLRPETKVMAVIKADAYGHGAVQVAKHLQDLGVWGFGVGDSAEALDLRESGITLPVLVLGAIVEGEIERVIENGISVSIHSHKSAERLSRETARHSRRLKVHLLVDTGMGRLGVPCEMAESLARQIEASPGLDFVGVGTHYASTNDPDDPYTSLQLGRFKEVASTLSRAGIYPEIYHASNSGAIFSSIADHLNVVRPGIVLYGILPSPAYVSEIELDPVLSLRSQVVFMKDLPAGTPLGYNCSYITERATRIATLSIGYNDGFPYRLTGKGRVLIRGQSAPVVGAVTMDYIMVDIGRIPGVNVGDMATIIGSDGEESITVDEIAESAGTIPYEVTCSIGKRVRRITRKAKPDSSAP